MARMAFAALAPAVRRSAARVAAGAYAAWAWGLAALTLLVLLPALVLIPVESARWIVLRAVFRTLMRLAGISFAVRGRENLPPRNRPCVFVANHASYLDGFVLAAAIPRPFSFVAKAELGEQFLPRLLLGRLGTEYVRRLAKADAIADSKRLVARVRAGRGLMYFPEGTLMRAPGLLPFRLGAFEAAVAAGVPVVPVVIRGTRSILRDQSWFPRRGPITVTIEPAVDAAAVAESEPDPFKAAIRARDLVRESILRRCGEPDAGHVQLPF